MLEDNVLQQGVKSFVTGGNYNVVPNYKLPLYIGGFFIGGIKIGTIILYLMRKQGYNRVIN